MSGELDHLDRLARSFGVETSYVDIHGRTIHPSPDAILHVLRAMGAPVGNMSDLPDAIRQREQRCVEALLRLYAFRSSDAKTADLPLRVSPVPQTGMFSGACSRRVWSGPRTA